MSTAAAPTEGSPHLAATDFVELQQKLPSGRFRSCGVRAFGISDLPNARVRRGNLDMVQRSIMVQRSNALRPETGRKSGQKRYRLWKTGTLAALILKSSHSSDPQLTMASSHF